MDGSANTPASAGDRKPVVAMIHAGALPGTPGHRQSLDEIVKVACDEARRYEKADINALMLENMHDVPYLRGGVGPEIVAAMTVIARAVRQTTSLPIGLQILAAADIEAMAVAHAVGLDFIRTECFGFAHVADEGIMESNAAKLLRYRRMIGATAVQVWADIKKKHASHAWTADLSLGDMAEAAEFMGADTIIVTGTSTGRPPQPADVAAARERSKLPVYVGSGASEENLAALLEVSDGLIVGSHFKKDGYWANGIDPARVRRFMAKAGPLQRGSIPAGKAKRTSSATQAELTIGSSIPTPGIQSAPTAPSVPPRLAIPPFPQQPR